MFIPADDLQRLRRGISKLYQEKRVVVAPCRCKLYISRSQKVIDVEGKTSPDWNFFANGVTSLIYNPDNHGLLLTLFDVKTSRLLWMLKMNENTIVRAPNSTFHIVNTSQDFDEHVGMIYESRDVANLLLNTYELLSQRRQQLIADAENGMSVLERGDSGNDTSIKGGNVVVGSTYSPAAGLKRNRRSKLLRSLSFHSRNRSSKDTTTQERRGRSLTVGPEDFPDPSLLRLERNRRPVSSPNATDYQATVGDHNPTQEGKPNNTDDPADTLDLRISLSERRTDTSIRFGKSEHRPSSTATSPVAAKRTQCEPSASFDHTSAAVGSTSHPTGFTRGRLFFSKKIKLTRSQSLKVSRKSSDASQCHGATNASLRSPSKSMATDELLEQNKQEREQYAKQRVTKPRACSDSLLLHGSVVKCIVDTGNAAKKSREKRSLMKALSYGRGETTDLCTTEL